MTSDELALLGALRATLPTPDDEAFAQACALAAPRHDWSRLHPRCVGCQTVDHPHYAKGALPLVLRARRRREPREMTRVGVYAAEVTTTAYFGIDSSGHSASAAGLVEGRDLITVAKRGAGLTQAELAFAHLRAVR